MDADQFKKDLIKVVRKHRDGLAVFLFGFTYVTDDGKIACFGNTVIPMPPRDHEEEALRNNTSKKASELAMELTKNTYHGR